MSLLMCAGLAVFLMLFHNAVRTALQAVFAVPARCVESAEKLVDQLNIWVGTLRPRPEERLSIWGEFQGVIVLACSCCLGYAEYIVLQAAFQLLLPERFANWLAFSGALLTALVSYAYHAASSRRLRAAAFAVTILFLAAVGSLAYLRALEIDSIRREAAMNVAMYGEPVDSGSVLINDGSAKVPESLQPVRTAAARELSEQWFSRNAVLSALIALLYALAEMIAICLALDLAGAGILAFVLFPLRAAVWLPLAGLRLINASGLLRLPGILAGWLCAIAQAAGDKLRRAPSSIMKAYDLWKERRIRRPFEVHGLSARLENEKAILKEYLKTVRELRLQFLKSSLEEQLQRQLQVHAEALGAQRGKALDLMLGEDAQYVIPVWTKLQSEMDGKAKAQHVNSKVN